MGRRNTRRNSTKPAKNEGNEEAKKHVMKGEASLLQSPTPYWKVAKERGGFSPPETRSAKKQWKGKRLDFLSHDDIEDKEKEPDEK